MVRRIVGIVVLLLVLPIVLPLFININRFRHSLVHSISVGLGRPVEASSVDLQLFPRPGFVLHNLTVEEDPAFGTEPVMTAESVRASLRLSTLWHRRVEIARLHFDRASVNLVQNADSRWNFESLLGNSPALHARREAVPGRPVAFPYVEVTRARINFKHGAEKLPLSLEEAKLALWREQGSTWGVRLRARPVRTDLPVADAGEIRGEGSLAAGARLATSPLHGRLEWRRVQLGEITRLLHGEDEGWRGTVDWVAYLQGSLEDAAFFTRASVEGFHRAEIVPANAMDLGAECTGRVVRKDARQNRLDCHAPMDSGRMTLHGDFSGAAPMLHVEMAEAPAGFFLDLLQHVHPGVPGSVSATGEVHGTADCAWRGAETLSACAGNLQAAELRWNLPNLPEPLVLAPVKLTAASEGAGVWNLTPVHVTLGGASPAVLSGSLNAQGAHLELHGPADLTVLDRVAETLRIPAVSGEVESIRGSAQMSVAVDTSWLPRLAAAGSSGAEFAPAAWTGSLQLENAALQLKALPVELSLNAATVDLWPGSIAWNLTDASFGRIPFQGNVGWQTPCPAAAASCGRVFTLHMPNLNTGRLQAALLHGSHASKLLGLIDSWTGSEPQMPAMSGTLRVDTLSVGKLTVKNAELRLRLAGEKAELVGISGNAFEGSLRGGNLVNATTAAAGAEPMAGAVEWGNGAPVYTLQLTLSGMQPDSAAALWHERWGSGTADGTVRLKMQGWSMAELASSAAGDFSWDWRNGSWGEGKNTLLFAEWKAAGKIADQKLQIPAGQMRLDSSAGDALRRTSGRANGKQDEMEQTTTGQVDFARRLHLTLAPSGTVLRGTLGAPGVTPGADSGSGAQRSGDENRAAD